MLNYEFRYDKQVTVYKPAFDIVAFAKHGYSELWVQMHDSDGEILRLSPSAVSSRRSETLLLILTYHLTQ